MFPGCNAQVQCHAFKGWQGGFIGEGGVSAQAQVTVTRSFEKHTRVNALHLVCVTMISRKEQ